MTHTIRQQEDAIFAHWKTTPRFARVEFNPDGLVDEACYQVAPTKLLFVLKQVAEPADLREFLHRGAHKTPSSPSWTAVTRWICGVEQFLKTGRVPYWHEVEQVAVTGQRSRRPLRRACMVNVMKVAGGGSTQDKEVLAAVDATGDLLAKQLSLYDADLTICCGSVVWKALDSLSLPNRGVVKQTRRGVQYRTAGRLGTILEFAHPANRGLPSHTFYALLDAIAEIRTRG